MSPSALADGPPSQIPLSDGKKSAIFTKKGSDLQSMCVAANRKDGTSAVPTMPEFKSNKEEQKYCKARLACAFRVFASKGFDEGVAGHMSLRDPIRRDHFWINPYVGPSYIPADCNLFGALTLMSIASGKVIEGEHAVNAAGFSIHSEIHKAHPWINAVCHGHSVSGKAYSVFGKPLPPLMQDSLHFYGTHSVNRHYGGVVLSADEGKAIAAAIRPQDKVCILQNHGLLSVGTTIDEAAYWSISFDKCCQAQLMVDAAAALDPENNRPKEVDHETAFFTEKSSGSRYRGWLDFHPYYTNMLKKTKGGFLI